jgi:hypothetical protein
VWNPLNSCTVFQNLKVFKLKSLLFIPDRL